MSELLERIADQLGRIRLVLERQLLVGPVAVRQRETWKAFVFWLALAGTTVLTWQVLRTGRP